MTSRVPFVFVFSGVHHRKDTCECKDSGRGSDVGAQKRFESTDRNKNKSEYLSIKSKINLKNSINHIFLSLYYIFEEMIKKEGANLCFNYSKLAF